MSQSYDEPGQTPDQEPTAPDDGVEAPAEQVVPDADVPS